MADVVLKNSSGKDETYQGIDNVTLLNTEGNPETFVNERLIQNQIQADWNQTDDTAVDYIKNKPEIFEAEDELPVVTTEDDGKLLGVLNGEWTKVDAPEGGNSGVIETDIFSRQTLNGFAPDNRVFGTYAYMLPDDAEFLHLTLGELYSVEWDGTVSECTAIDVSAMYGDGSVGLGDYSRFNDPDAEINYEQTGEPFAVLVSPYFEAQGFISWHDEELSHTVRIYQKVETQSLPIVDNSDNGKILSVVDGLWAATEAPTTQKQADMAQTDSTSADFVKNQYFGVLPDLIPTQEYGFKTEGGWAGDIKAFSIPKGLTQLVEGEQYLVQWGDTSQVLIAKLFDDGEGGFTNTVLYIGNVSILLPNTIDGVVDTGEPFVITENNTANTISFATNDLAIEKLVAGAKLANNEKRLDSKWLPETIQPLPEVSEVDNGKVLGVVNGAWAKMDAPKDNVTVTEEDLFPTETIEFSPHPNFTHLYFGYLGNLFSLIAGETYYVVWGEDTFKCVAQEVTSPIAGIAIGNLSLAGMGEDTGEPFAIAYGLEDNSTAAFTLSTDSTHTIRIYQKIENGGGGQTGFIEKEVLVEWDTSVMPTVTFDIPELNHTLYKLADATPTKEQLLAAEFRISSANGDSDMYTQTISETDILMATDDIIGFQFSSEPTFGYAVCYVAGEISVDFNGISLTITVPEAGFYQLWTIGMEFPNTLVGSMSYTVTEKVDFIQSDWNQADSTQPDYIKNKPFGLGEMQIKPFLPTTTMTLAYSSNSFFGSYYISSSEPTEEDLIAWASNWDIAKIIWDGVEYICEPKNYQGIKFIGNFAAWGGFGDSGEPFIFGYGYGAFNNMLVIDLATPVTEDTTEGAMVAHEVAISLGQQSIIKLDPKFIENIDYETQVINKPFGSIPSGTVVFNGVVDCNQQDGDSEYIGMIDQIDLISGAAYLVEIDGTSFNAVAQSGEGAIGIVLDDCAILSGIISGQTMVLLNSQGMHSLKIQIAEEYIKKLDAKYLPDGIGTLSNVVAIDFSAYEINGQIRETYADGTVKTTTIEFDTNGNPIKFIDGNGNITTITW